MIYYRLKSKLATEMHYILINGDGLPVVAHLTQVPEAVKDLDKWGRDKLAEFHYSSPDHCNSYMSVGLYENKLTARGHVAKDLSFFIDNKKLTAKQARIDTFNIKHDCIGMYSPESRQNVTLLIPKKFMEFSEYLQQYNRDSNELNLLKNLITVLPDNHPFKVLNDKLNSLDRLYEHAKKLEGIAQSPLKSLCFNTVIKTHEIDQVLKISNRLILFSMLCNNSEQIEHQMLEYMKSIRQIRPGVSASPSLRSLIVATLAASACFATCTLLGTLALPVTITFTVASAVLFGFINDIIEGEPDYLYRSLFAEGNSLLNSLAESHGLVSRFSR